MIQNNSQRSNHETIHLLKTTTSVNTTYATNAVESSEVDDAGRWALHINVDSSNNHDAWGIAFIGDADDSKLDVLMVSLGISANEIESGKIIAAYGRKEINS